MTGTSHNNPYEAPIQAPDQTASVSGGLSRSQLVVNSGFLLINFAILAVAQSSLADLLVEFEIQLSTVSFTAYQISQNWIVSVVVLLIFTVCVTLIDAKLKRSGNRFCSLFRIAVISIWTLFTTGFAFGILHPLYGVVTGLTG